MPLSKKSHCLQCCCRITVLILLSYPSKITFQNSNVSSHHVNRGIFTVHAVTPAVVWIVLMPLLEVHLPRVGHSFASHVLHCTEMPLGGDNVTPIPPPFLPPSDTHLATLNIYWPGMSQGLS